MKNIIYNNYKLSQLCLGTVQFGLDYGIANEKGKPDQNSVDEIIKYLIEKGLNCFDTAINYGDSQEVIGKCFKALHKEPFVVSKISTQDFNDNFEISVKKALDDLNISSLFGLLLHDTKQLELWQESDTLKVQNLIDKNLLKFFGVSIYTKEEFEIALENPNITLIQIPFNLFDLRAINENWFEKAKEKNKQIFIRSLFLQGLLLMPLEKVPAKLEKAKPYLLKFEELAKEFALSKNELALSFVKSVAKESVLLFGCESLVQAKENLTNFENLKILDQNQINKIIASFKDISEDIYLPTRW